MALTRVGVVLALSQTPQVPAQARVDVSRRDSDQAVSRGAESRMSPQRAE